VDDKSKKPKNKKEIDHMLDELEDSTEPKEAQMHSIQEVREEDELEHYSRGMRTGLSIEDDEAEEFNRRVDTHFQYTEDGREDIEEMPVAGTQTIVNHQQQEEHPQQQLDDYEEIEEDEQDYENYEDEEQFNGDEHQDIVGDQTIPIEQPQDATQFSVHNSGSKYDQTEHIEIPQETAPVFIDHNTERPDGTTFSIKKVEQNEEIVENVKDNSEEQIYDEEDDKINSEEDAEIVDESPKKEETSIN
jgi:hypothetical protein